MSERIYLSTRCPLDQVGVPDKALCGDWCQWFTGTVVPFGTTYLRDACRLLNALETIADQLYQTRRGIQT